MSEGQSEKIRVLIVDDTSLYRKILSDIFSSFPEVEVVGTANNGKIALAKIERLKPDIVTLDFEMPEMDGLATLRRLKIEAPDVSAIMVSSHTRLGAKITLEALELGAFDFIAKPASESGERNFEDLRARLRPIVLTFRNRKLLAAMLRKRGANGVAPAAIPPSTPNRDSASRPAWMVAGGRIEIVAIGISTGGPNALAKLLPLLPENLGVPVVVVQHMPPVFTAALAESLDKKCALSIFEGVDGQILEKNQVYLAPGGKQMRIELHRESQKTCLRLSDDPPENHCRPSVDFLFRSVARFYENRALAVIMTGMGADGTAGLKVLKGKGARVIAQNEESCVVFGMPMEAIRAGVVDTVLPLDSIAAEIVRLVQRKG